MKKKLLILVSLVTVLNTTSCNTQTEKTYKQNTIYDVELSEDEKDVLDLVGARSEMDIYEFNVDENFTELNIWLEVYKDGELLSRANEFSTDIKPGKGRIAVKVEGEQQELWTIKYKDEESEASAVFELEEELKNNINSFSSNGNLDEVIEVADDKEIILKKYLFSNGDSFNSFNNQYYAEQPSVIKDYPYVYLLKCKIIGDEKEVIEK